MLPSLNERRSAFIYEAGRLAAIAALAPVIPEPWPDRERAFQDQFLEVIERQCKSASDLRSVAERALRYISENKPCEDLEYDLKDALGASPEKVHEDWVKAYEAMGWTWGPQRSLEKRTHPDMVPYSQLGQEEQDKDSVFIGLCEIARKWVRPRD